MAVRKRKLRPRNVTVSSVINKYHHNGRVPDHAVNIMRGTAFGNPFPINAQHDRATVIQMYREYLHKRVHEDPVFAQQVRELHGKTLCCCCKPQACHGDVLISAAKWLQTNLL